MTGINDPRAAMNAIDGLGAALCDPAPLTSPSGAHLRGGRCVLVVPAVDCGGLVDAKFHLVRRIADASGAVLIRHFRLAAIVARDASALIKVRAAPIATPA